MVDRLPVWSFLSISLILLSFAYYPLVRYGLQLDAAITMPPSTMAMLLIGGWMSGLCAMLLMVSRQPQIAHAQQQPEPDLTATRYIHASGLLILSSVPLANFLLCFYLWTKYRRRSRWLDQAGIETLNFQISIYLYLLLSAFMVFAVVGLITTPLILLFYLICVITAIAQTTRGKQFHYPMNIPVIQGRAMRS